MRSAGLDVGSRSIELVVVHDGEVELCRREETTFDPLVQCQRILDGTRWDRLTATGYGRKLAGDAFSAGTITEIQAYALGAVHYFPEARAVLDIGGQDTKAISLSPEGRVLKFEMNDRCAAGTGKFLEFMAASFGVSIDRFGDFALKGREGIQINSMCTVFAETEATSLMARGHRPEDIALALHQSALRRSLSMLARVATESPVLFAGGVARNVCMVRLLASRFQGDLLIPESPDVVGATGAALYGARNNGPGTSACGAPGSA